jgi:type IV secretory pathway ATPase VirB11/archaellum biosynthesis ATPase
MTTEPTDPSPKFVRGDRFVSLAGLREHIEAQFIAETGWRADLLFQTTEADRRDLIRDITDYVLATETVSLTRAERSAVQDEVYGNLFLMGPLSAEIGDPQVVEIAIRGPKDITVKRLSGESAGEISFDDALHLERVLRYALLSESVEFGVEPFIETGIRYGGRRARLTVVGAPISATLQANLRLHSPQPATLNSLLARGWLDSPDADLLMKLITSTDGLMIVGEPNAGKTTLLQALLPYLPPVGGTAVIERAAELELPSGMGHAVPTPGHDFATRITESLTTGSRTLALDEVRFDEAAPMWAALTEPPAPRCIWVLRGSTEPLRLRTAFSMAVRRASQGIDQQAIHHALLNRLPTVVLMGRRDGQPRVLRIARWTAIDSDPSGLTLIDL